jgi:hypothetical protein
MIPPPDPASGNLPAGIHEAGWDEVAQRFGRTAHRRELLRGLYEAMMALRAAGCRWLYLNGSFVTEKDEPADFDGCSDSHGMDIDRLEELAPELLDFSQSRAAQKARFNGELFPAEWPADLVGTRFLDFFQRSRQGAPNGIVVIDPESLP